MKHTLILLLLLLVLVLIWGCNQVNFESQWADKPIAVDGNLADWADAPLYYSEETYSSVGLRNDADNLYVQFRFNDAQLARKIQRHGVTIWLSQNGKKDKDFGIRYAGSQELNQAAKPGRDMPERERLEIEDGPLPDIPRPESKLAPGTITVIRQDEEESMLENHMYGPAAGSALTDGLYCFEFRVPLQLSVEPGQSVGLGVRIGGLSDEDREKMREEMDSRSGGGGRGMGKAGGGMGGRGGGRGGRGGGMEGPSGGGRGGDRPDKSQEMQKQEYWLKVKLAEKI